MNFTKGEKMKNNQLDNQVENQVEKNLDKNISCNIFFEQINLINQLPIEERGNVLYMAILNAFIKNQDNQLDNQLENAYISISISLSNSLSILSKSVLDILNKTIICKKYKSNWGGNRKGSGRPIKNTKEDIDVKLYGEYGNVYLTKENHDKLLAMCLSEKLLNELVNSFSIQIEVGKERPYTAELPNAHYERLKSYYNYRKRHPEKFREETTNNDAVWERLRQKWEKKEVVNANMGVH